MKTVTYMARLKANKMPTLADLERFVDDAYELGIDPDATVSVYSNSSIGSIEVMMVASRSEDA